MPAIHNIECKVCGHVETNAYIKNTSSKRLPRCKATVEGVKCGGRTQIAWSFGSARHASVHPRERAVIWMNRKTGSVATPPANNVPMPDRYAKNGYERVEFESLHALDKYCAERKLVNEVASFDKSGNQDDL